MTTIIRSNGSRWLGQAPATLDELFSVLEHHPLKRFSHYQTCMDEPQETGEASPFPGRYMKFWGNFEDVSHGFDVDTDDPEVQSKLAGRFLSNKRNPPDPLRSGEVCACHDAHFGRFGEE